MKRTLLFLSLLIFTTGAFAQTAIAAERMPDLDASQVDEDIRIFQGLIQELHPGLHWYVTELELEAAFEAIKKGAADTISTLELYRGILRTISKIGCGHTWADASGALDTYLWGDEGTLPLKLKIIEGEIYCHRNESPRKSPIRQGDKILTINGKSSKTLVESFVPFAIADGYGQTGRIRWVEHKFDFYYTLLYRKPDTYVIEYQNEAGITKRTIVDAKSTGIQKQTAGDLLHSDSPESRNTLEFFGSTDIALLKIPDFSQDTTEFSREMEGLFDRIASSRTENLILDLRGNRGGWDGSGRVLLSYLLDHPMEEFERVYMKTIDPKFREYTDIRDEEIEQMAAITKKVDDTTYVFTEYFSDSRIVPKKPAYSGQLLVLIDGRTFSTAADVAAILSSETEAVFFGEETGGGYYGNTSGPVVNVTLPNSKIKIRIPLLRYETNVGRDRPPGRGVIPDHNVVPAVNDLRNGDDSTLNAALTFIKNQ